MEFPDNVFAWRKQFNDDLGFVPLKEPMPTAAHPGSCEKVLVLAERASRGQKLWVQNDARQLCDRHEYEFDQEEFSIVGNEASGAAIGKDSSGSRHRYAVWKKIGDAQLKLHYVLKTAGRSDDFGRSETLSRVVRHAKALRAGWVVVTSLFSARVTQECELDVMQYPMTEFGLMFIRWFAKNCNKTIACWGETRRRDQFRDVGWMLDRTVRKRLYALAPNEFWPPELPESPEKSEVHRYFYRDLLVASGEALDEDERDSDLAEDNEDLVAYAEPIDHDDFEEQKQNVRKLLKGSINAVG